MMRGKLLSKRFFILLFVIMICQVDGFGGIVGGLSEEKEADDNVKNLVEQIESDERLNNYGKLEAISYKTQLVSGINYFVKVLRASFHGLHFVNMEIETRISVHYVFLPKVGSLMVKPKDSDEYLHLRIYAPFNSSPASLTKIQENKMESDEIDYFE